VNPELDDDSLLRRSVIAAATFQAALLVALLLPAWSLRFWQAWVYWALFGAFVVLSSWYFVKNDPALVRRRLHVGPTAEREHSQKIIQGLAGGLVFLVFLVPGFDHRFGWSAVPTPLVWLGDVVMLAGWLFVFRVLRENTFAASTITVEAAQRVISTGPYAWVRHPMYAGSAVAFLATPLALGSWWALLPALLLCATLVVRLRDEERYLTLHLPGYDEYRCRVRWRLLPGVW
jgi:protein-S-isoprenylcysteine O-methyltransferase Ste14